MNGIANRVVGRAARLAGAPRDAGAGIDLLVARDDQVRAGDVLLRAHADSAPLLEFAVAYLGQHPEVVEVSAT